MNPTMRGNTSEFLRILTSLYVARSPPPPLSLRDLGTFRPLSEALPTWFRLPPGAVRFHSAAN